MAASTLQLTPTTTRVHEHTDPKNNRRIREEMEDRIALYVGASPDIIDRRLEQLDQEWDIERTLEANAASISLAGSVLGLLFGRQYFIFPGAVSAFLLQHALQGWCPPLTFFRRRGVRTATEIAEERTALKAIRGDFDNASSWKDDVNAMLAAIRR